LVRFENVGMRYGISREVLRDITFTLEPGSFHFISGASGAGKSSLLRLLSLAHRPSRGLITMFGEDIATTTRDGLAALRRRIGMVFQDFRLIDHLSARDNVALPLRIAGAREAEVRKMVEELLDWVGLGERFDAPPATLSGGEQQRLAIARAIIRRPDLLLADEPTGNVDPNNSRRLLSLFEQLNHKLGTTVVIATHDESLPAQFHHPNMWLRNGALIHEEMRAPAVR